MTVATTRTGPTSIDASLEGSSRSDKIGARHLERLAVVYIRQSTMTQVHHNQESTKLQYSLVQSAIAFGWTRERILVIDEDLGMSGTSAVTRAGFQRLLAEVALDHVGVIFGVEMSRLARSNRDWHGLLELCARFGTLIADLDGLYDPAQYNDRLLLGLKGTMSEAELHMLRQRLLQGKLQKARRGELGMPVPTGYLRTASGEIVLDPDEEVQSVVRFVFDQFARHQNVQATLHELVEHRVRIGVRLRAGPEMGKLVWHRPHRHMISNILRNPIYAGAYVYGRRQVDPRRQKPGKRASGRTPLLGPDRWKVCLRDRLPAYISWDQYQANQETLKRNRATAQGRGSARAAATLLGGLVVCGHCGHRLCVQYPVRKQRCWARYTCNQDRVHYGAPLCGSLSARRLDEVVTQLVLAALAPGALEVSMRVADDLEKRRIEADDLWNKRLERARYECERARRQYEAVEPEHRLVARTLERAWEEALRAERELREHYERTRAEQPRRLTAQERDSIRALASDLPRVWNGPMTTTIERKQILRLVIDKVVVVVDAKSEWVEAAIHWAGGHTTKLSFRRPVGRLTQLNGYTQIIERIHQLRRDGYTAARIAERLNAEGWVTPTQRSGFNPRLIHAMMEQHGFVPRGPLAPPTDDPNEWRLADLAQELGMSRVTLYGWLRRGWLHARRLHDQWVVTADRNEQQRLRRLRREQLRFSHG